MNNMRTIQHSGRLLASLVGRLVVGMPQSSLRSSPHSSRLALVRGLVAGALAVAAMTAAAPAAHADPTVSCSIIEIEAATGEPPAMDGALKPLEKKLRKPPFSSWNNFKQLGSQSVSLETMKPGDVSLVHGKATLLLREVTTGGKKPRLSLGIALDDAAGKRVLDSKVNVDAGEYLVVGRSLAGNKGHLVALSCR